MENKALKYTVRVVAVLLFAVGTNACASSPSRPPIAPVPNAMELSKIFSTNDDDGRTRNPHIAPIFVDQDFENKDKQTPYHCAWTTPYKVLDCSGGVSQVDGF